MRKHLLTKHKERIQQTKEKLPKLESLKNLKIAYIPYNELFREGIIAGLGWAVGVTIGFVIVSSLLVLILNLLGGLPFIGNVIASIVESTQQQLVKRTPLIPQ